MKKSDEIKQWLALVAEARIAVAKCGAGGKSINGVDDWEVRQAEEYLTNAFLAGLEAHGKALLEEHLAVAEAAVA